ncbi:MAG: Lrp/AsnC family transcriptional regulator [Nanoarchaeota archaeon]
MGKEVDEKDKLILFELLQDCRQSLAKIGRTADLPQQTVSYRIKRLEDLGIIKKYTINIDYSKLGFNRHSLYLDIKGINLEEADDYLAEIMNIKYVSCCYTLHDASEWKIYVSIWTRTIEEYDDIQTKILSKFKGKVNNYLSFQSIKSFTYFARRLNSKEESQVDIKFSSEKYEISDVDWKILDKLKENSKIPTLELAKKLKINANTIVRKINELKKKGIIQRFYPLLNAKKMGYYEYTFISRVDPSYKKEIEEFIEYTKKDPRFIMVIKAVGYVNLSYSFLVENYEELNEIKSTVESILGEAVIDNFKIEIENMVG